VTEIPEHLLKRSRDRRGGAGASGEAAPAATSGDNTPAVATPKVPAKAQKTAPVAKVAKPDSPVVAAAKNRKKIPFWAMATMSLLPLWAFLYVLGIKPAEKTVEGPLAVGTAAYAGCAGCHGAAGGGGAGRVFSGGEALKTFPHIEDMLNFVYTGSQQYVAEGIKVYGDPDREGGAHAPLSYNGNPMPQQGVKYGGALTEYEILGVVCHVRYDLAGADSGSEEWATEYENWCSPESEIFAALEAGTTSFDTLADDFAMLEDKPNVVGTAPRETTAK
jgi:mono/diheme cytochrome c family protein